MTRSKRAASAQRRAPRARASAPLALGPALTITEVNDCWRSITAMLDGGRAEADASALVTVDTAGLQLLLASGVAARERGLRLTLSGAEELLLSSARTVGLDMNLTDVLEFTP